MSYIVILLQAMPDPDALLNAGTKEGFDISPTNVYGWLIWILVGFMTYLKAESLFKSWTIRKKDAYIKELHQKLIDAEKTSVTSEEFQIINDISKAKEPLQIQ